MMELKMCQWKRMFNFSVRVEREIEINKNNIAKQNHFLKKY